VRIAVDGRELEGRRTGVGRYLHEILAAWSSSGDAGAHDITLYTARPVDMAPYAPLRARHVLAPGGGFTWEQWVLPRLLRREPPDVLLAPAYTAPLGTRVPVVLVMHDVSFSARPEWFSWREGARRRVTARLAAERAALVVTDSRFSKVEIERHLGIPPHRIAIVPIGVTRRSVPARHRDPGGVLFVGSIFNRRHVPTLIESVALLARRGRDVRLDIIGDNRTMPRLDLRATADSAGVGDRVRVRDFVAEDALDESYATASAFAFLSEYEGFGLTPLEALSAGVPPVVLDTPVAREVYGTSAEYVRAPDASLVADALDRVLFDGGARARILDASTAHLDRYSWERAASSVLSLLESAGRRG
jgi:glycosyltransferase involved in cell wall biosynthesis